jgi:hypothetical protein
MIYILYSLVRCVLWYRCGWSWWMFNVSLRVLCILLLLDSINVNQIQLIGSVLSSTRNFSWFSSCLICPVRQKGIEVSECKVESFSLPVYQFLPHVVWHSFNRYIHIISSVLPLFIPVFIFALPKINIAISAFFW